MAVFEQVHGHRPTMRRANRNIRIVQIPEPPPEFCPVADGGKASWVSAAAVPVTVGAGARTDYRFGLDVEVANPVDTDASPVHRNAWYAAKPGRGALSTTSKTSPESSDRRYHVGVDEPRDAARGHLDGVGVPTLTVKRHVTFRVGPLLPRVAGEDVDVRAAGSKSRHRECCACSPGAWSGQRGQARRKPCSPARRRTRRVHGAATPHWPSAPPWRRRIVVTEPRRLGSLEPVDRAVQHEQAPADEGRAGLGGGGRMLRAKAR